MEFFYGITMAARVAYSSYIFSLVPATVYQRVASYSRSSVLMGVFTSSVLGQICVSLVGVSYRTLSAVSLGFVTFGLLVSFCLPWPKRSLFFNQARLEEERKEAAQSELARMKPEENDGSVAAQSSNHKSPCWTNSVFIQMLKELKHLVKVPSLRLWSLWWVFNSAGYYLVLFYVHILWNKVYPATENKHVYNGAVEAASTLLGKMDFNVL